jgi:hypothetical protein
MTVLRENGVQCVRSFFSEETKTDLRARAQTIINMRAEGTLSVDTQDSQGLPYEWFEPLVRQPELISLATAFLGPDVCARGWRILAKDKHFSKAIHIHQDWPYNPGDTRKLTLFVPLTPVNKANSALIFLEKSHLLGPVSRGPLDPSRFPPMNEVQFNIDVGDLLLCDFLTWHYSDAPENEDERLMIQLNYQPASDPSSKHLVAGIMPHNMSLNSRFDASSVPSVELNAVQARAYFEAGDIDRASRYARGLLFDDPAHAGAALVLYDILSREKNPSALKYLEIARASAINTLDEVAKRDTAFADMTTARSSSGDAGWRPLALSMSSYLPEYGESALPAAFGTPENAWSYGAYSDVIDAKSPATLRVRATATKGKIGICLVSEDFGALASDAHVITPETGEATVMIALEPDKAPARLLVRNHDDPGQTGEVRLSSVDVVEYS